MEWVSVLGFVATVCSLIANFPQVWKSRKVGCTEDLHLYTFILHFLACVLWGVYAYGLSLYIMLVECSICAILNSILILFIIRDRSINTIKNTKNVRTTVCAELEKG